MSVRTDRFSVDEITGRTVIVHSDPDDFHSQPSGNAGKKIACGVIRKGRQQSSTIPIWMVLLLFDLTDQFSVIF